MTSEEEAAVWPKCELVGHVFNEGAARLDQYAYIYGDINEAGLKSLLFHLSDSLKAHYRTHLGVENLRVYISLYYEREAAELTAAKGENMGGRFGLLYGSDPNNPSRVLLSKPWQRVLEGPHVKFGLTEEERITIFEDFTVASRAMEEQLRQQAPANKAELAHLRSMLSLRSDSVLAAKYGITPALVDSIFEESVHYGWGWRWDKTDP